MYKELISFKEHFALLIFYFFISPSSLSESNPQIILIRLKLAADTKSRLLLERSSNRMIPNRLHKYELVIGVVMGVAGALFSTYILY